jgi:hypothetical protein
MGITEVRQSAAGARGFRARFPWRIENLTMQKTLARLRLSLHDSLPSIVFPVKNTCPAAASPDPRYETQRGRNADGEKDLQVVIHDSLQSLQLTPGGLAPTIC